MSSRGTCHKPTRKAGGILNSPARRDTYNKSSEADAAFDDPLESDDPFDDPLESDHPFDYLSEIDQPSDDVLDLVSPNENSFDGTFIDMNGAVDVAAAVTTCSTITTPGSLLPASSDGAGIGSSTAEFSDVFLADGAVINLGDKQEVSLTHIEDEGLILNGLSQMQFGDSGTKIYQSADGVLD